MTAVKNGWALVDKSTGAVLQEYDGAHTRQLHIPTPDGTQFTWHEPPYDRGGRKVVERWRDDDIPTDHKDTGTTISFDGTRANVIHTSVPLTAAEIAQRDREIARLNLESTDQSMFQVIEELLERQDAIIAAIVPTQPIPDVPRAVRDRIAQRKALRAQTR